MRISDWSSDVCSSDLGFHRQMGDTLICQLGKRRLQGYGVWRGGAQIMFAARRDNADRAETGRVKTQRHPNLAQKRDNRRLAICAGDGSNDIRRTEERVAGK